MISLLDADVTQREGFIEKASNLKVFEIQIYLIAIGSYTRTNYFRFPTYDNGYEVSEDSFVDVLLLDDYFYGKERFLVALKKGWVYIFTTFFQDSEIESWQAFKLEENHEILSIVSQDVFAVALMEDQTNKRLKIALYRINPYKGSFLEHQCDINLDKQLSNKEYRPELSLTVVVYTYLLFVNFPEDEILSYHFQIPTINMARVPVSVCPIKGSPVEFYQQELSYSLGYMMKNADDGLLFSPMNPASRTSYIVRYCYPNTYWNETSGCQTCENGYSNGGAQPQCIPCPTSDKYAPVSYDPMHKTCYIQCIEEKRFGPSCLPCDEYMISINANLPPGSHWGVHSGFCTFICDSGYTDTKTRACISREDYLVRLDSCAQVKDCFNCYMTPTCGWCDGRCRHVLYCSNYKSVEGSVFQNFVRYAAKTCSYYQVAICGERSFHSLRDKIIFKAATLQKNVICKWNIDSQYNEIIAIDRIDLVIKVTGAGFDKTRTHSSPVLFVTTYCLISSCESSQIGEITLEKGTALHSFNATALSLIFWTDHIISDDVSLEIEYRSFQPPKDLRESFWIVLKWMIIVIAVWGVIWGLIMLAHKIHKIYRAHFDRNRILIELQGINQFGDYMELDDRNINELIADNQMVKMMIYDSQAANDFEQAECPICLDDFKSLEALAKIVVCKHIFHAKCFEDWVKSRNRHAMKCPFCKSELS